ncbi:hypothetical protein B0T18DRAFT_422153 [Schizothecium vesticola]|uniref:Uncharacterized protein n=1 Tax=Schizothecium vesticola TaxID=314040 RepID=A0AA40EEH4_9PEZI|nr:hypothetical protein B0T18DRAFT_422153 [Schizothecium vesticola]
MATSLGGGFIFGCWHSVQALFGGGRGRWGKEVQYYISLHLTLSLTVSMLSALYAHV